MRTILILNVDSSPIPGAEKYLPEPAMGNQKPGTTEYQSKWQEKRNKQLQDLQSHSFLSAPVSIQWALVDSDGIAFEPGNATVASGDPKVETVDSVKVLFDAIEKSKKIPEFISGVHPTTHCRIITNTAIRHGIQLPLFFLGRPRLNPWQLLSTQAEGEYPVLWAALDKKPVNPVVDTFRLLKALGPGILRHATEE